MARVNEAATQTVEEPLSLTSSQSGLADDVHCQVKAALEGAYGSPDLDCSTVVALCEYDVCFADLRARAQRPPEFACIGADVTVAVLLAPMPVMVSHEGSCGDAVSHEPQIATGRVLDRVCFHIRRC